MSEQQIATVVKEYPSLDGYTSWPDYWKAQGMPWRTEPEIDADRQTYLTKRRAVTPDTEKGIYPFRDENGSIKLTRADVEWLLATHESGGMRGPVDLRHVIQYQREGLDLRGTDLRGCDLSALPLSRMRGGVGRREWLDISAQQREAAAIHLEDTTLRGTWLEDARLTCAHMERAYLTDAQLAGCELVQAHLEGAIFLRATMKGRIVGSGTGPKGSRSSKSALLVLQPSDMHLAFLDNATSLHRAVLGDLKLGGIRLADVRWNDVNAARTSWREVRVTRDELIARSQYALSGAKKDAARRLEEYQTTVRAYRQLAILLRSQGLNEDSDRFAYRAQLLQKVVLRRQRQWIRLVGSSLLDLIAGYGYKPMRSLFAYLLVVLGFAVAYYLVAAQVAVFMPPLAALVFSVTSFHGRGFMPGENMPLTNPLTVLAAAEAIIGLLIEITFIATFTQRFFAR
ncbi:MAG TPA: pentapeptide repeat-containing protein [Ktedonobacterales bacterium]|nr:pentapeptide repeat-containing protein [Ktedonobacterales bacterium]